MKHIAFVIIILFGSSAAIADCTYDGVTYKEGTIIGPYICSSGQWVLR